MRVKCHQPETGKQKTLHGPRRAVERTWKRLEAEGWVQDSPEAEVPAGAEDLLAIDGIEAVQLAEIHEVIDEALHDD